MSYIFLSHLLNEHTPSYNNKDRFSNSPQNEIIKGASANTSFWNFTNNHIGTHIDLPYHFDVNGKKYEDYDAEDFVYTSVALIDIPCDWGMLITKNSYLWNQINTNVDLILIRTGYEKYRESDKYWNDNPGIDPELCDFLLDKYQKLRCVGFDFISLTSANHKTEGRLAHSALLKPKSNLEPILIIEDMTLTKAPTQIEKIIVAPLRVENSNGGAVTVLAKI